MKAMLCQRSNSDITDDEPGSPTEVLSSGYSNDGHHRCYHDDCSWRFRYEPAQRQHAGMVHRGTNGCVWCSFDVPEDTAKDGVQRALRDHWISDHPNTSEFRKYLWPECGACGDWLKDDPVGVGHVCERYPSEIPDGAQDRGVACRGTGVC
ncbi:hypothetical protein TWF281_002156 [Arthrobotrys megalospora]